MHGELKFSGNSSQALHGSQDGNGLLFCTAVQLLDLLQQNISLSEKIGCRKITDVQKKIGIG